MDSFTGRVASQYYIYTCMAYCYRRSSMVCLSIGLSVTIASPAETAEPIEITLGMLSVVGPWKHVLDGSPDTHAQG